jgi:hypothetical protein
MQHTPKDNLYDALKQLRQHIPQLADLLRLNRSKDVAAWTAVVDSKLLSRLSANFPVMATICGGGSAGKSTLFNSLLGDDVSPVGGSAGINRRVLVGAKRKLIDQQDNLAALFEPFGCRPDILRKKQELTVPGCPLVVASDDLPDNLVLMDTPDFDTGARGTYINREVAQQALATSDILIYIFTNSNYNNRENTDFIADMLTGIGMRKCFLVYRTYPSFEQEEVLHHAMTVAHNLYGRDAERYVLGIYRTDEDNAVAAGDRHMVLRPVRDEAPSFMQALKTIDLESLRMELLASILADVLDQAEDIVRQGRVSHAELTLYLDALQTAQSHCVRKALQHFPIDRVVKRFAEIWLATDPSYVKAMRKTGDLIEFPFRVIFNAAKKVKGSLSGAKPMDVSDVFVDQVEEDLVNSVNRMHDLAVNPDITVFSTQKDPVATRMLADVEYVRVAKGLHGGQLPRVKLPGEKGEVTFMVAAHPVVFPEQSRLRDTTWKPVLQSILAQKDVIIDLSAEIDEELRHMAISFRRQMGVWTKIRQTMSAFLNVVPATVAVTYILSTGDPIGAAGIKVKLTGMFGLHDLYALIAIPATTGLKKADQKQLDELLGPIVKTWLDDKMQSVKALFEAEITGDIIRVARNVADASDEVLSHVEFNVAACRKAMMKP